MVLFWKEINMKSKLFKVSLLLLSLLLVSSCKNKGSNNNDPVEEEDTFIPAEYESNGVLITNYKIVIPESNNSTINYAASELQSYLNKSIGSELEIIRDNVAETEYEIILGECNRKEVQDISFESLGDESYIIKNIEKDLLIAANSKRGLLYGVYSFLEALGYRYYTKDTERIPNAKDVFIPKDINLSWKPTFEYRETMFKVAWDASFAVKLKVNSDFQRNDLKNNAKYGGYSGYIGGGRYLVHTFKYLLPATTYQSEHPDWYAQNVGPTYSGPEYIQPCFSNYDSIDVVMQSIDSLIQNDPNSNILSISQNDGGVFCKCDKCNAAKERYNESGVMLLYLNKIAERVKVKYPNIKIDTLAYSWSLEAPKEVVAEDNIVIRFCTEMCPFHDDKHKCETLAKKEQYFIDWQEHASEFSVWTYPITWSNLYNSWPNLYELKDNIKFFVKHGVKGIYQEGFPEESCEFAELKCYILSKLAANPTMSDAEYEYHICDFLQGYYGDGWKYIRNYIEYAHDAILENINAYGCLNTHAGCDDLFDFKWNGSTYDMKFISKMNQCWDRAMDAASGETFKHVEKSSLHWTLIELYCTFDNRYLEADIDEMEELEERNKNLYLKLKEYGAIYKYDGKTINLNVTDFKSSPSTW